MPDKGDKEKEGRIGFGPTGHISQVQQFQLSCMSQHISVKLP